MKYNIPVNIPIIANSSSISNVDNSHLSIYVKSNGKFYYRDSNNAELLLNQIEVSTVTFVENNYGSETKFLLVAETNKLYYYVSSGSSYTVDDIFILNTKDGGDTRYVALDYGYLKNLVEDLSPRAGGNLDMNSHRLLESKGANVTSVNNLVLGTDGNTFIITGTTELRLIDYTGWSEGSSIILKFNGILTIKHNYTESGNNKSIILSGNYDYITKAGDIIVLTLIGGQWIENNNLTKISVIPSPYIYVDSVNGDDNRGSYIYPFKTINAAVTYATSNSIIYIKAGNYTVTAPISKDTITYIFDDNTYLTPSVDCAYIFVISDSVTGHHVSDYTNGFKVIGNVNITVNSPNVCIPVNIEYPNCIIDIEVKLIKHYTSSIIPVLILSNNKVLFKGNIESTEDIALSTEGTGEFNIKSKYIKRFFANQTEDINITEDYSNIAVGIHIANGLRNTSYIDIDYASSAKVYSYSSTSYFKFGNINMLEVLNSGAITTVMGTIGILIIGRDFYTSGVTTYGKIQKLILNAGVLCLYSDLYELDQTGGTLNLYGTVRGTFNKTGGIFNGYVASSSSDYVIGNNYQMQEVDKIIRFGINASNDSKVNIGGDSGTNNYDPLAIYDKLGTIITKFNNEGTIQQHEIATTPNATVNYGKYYIGIDKNLYYLSSDNINYLLSLVLKTENPNSGDILTYNSLTKTYKPQSSKEFDLVIHQTESNINANGVLNTFIPAGYYIQSIILEEINNGAAGNIILGSANGGNDIVGTVTIYGNDDRKLLISKDYFSKYNDTPIYITSTAWGTGAINLFFAFIKTR